MKTLLAVIATMALAFSAFAQESIERELIEHAVTATLAECGKPSPARNARPECVEKVDALLLPIDSYITRYGVAKEVTYPSGGKSITFNAKGHWAIRQLQRLVGHL
jgi:hypothetical protein